MMHSSNLTHTDGSVVHCDAQQQWGHDCPFVTACAALPVHLPFDSGWDLGILGSEADVSAGAGAWAWAWAWAGAGG